MTELREVFEMVTKQAEPDLDSWDEQERRQLRKARRRKIAAIAVVAAVIAGLVTFALATRPRTGTKPVGRPSTTIRTAPPIGAQVVALDGTVLQQIPAAPAAFFSGAYVVRRSPDGRTIAFYSTDGSVRRVPVDGTDAAVLTGSDPDPSAYHDSLSWSPDGSKITYTWGGDIYTMTANGSNKRRLTRSPRGTGSYDPAWSPDGSTVVYWSGSRILEDGGPPDAEIYTIPADGGTPTRLTHDNVPSFEPAWSPDGTQIVYRKSRDQQLWIMRADGSHSHLVARHLVNPWAPEWSPDGARIAFLSCCADHRSDAFAPLLEVQVLDLATGGVQRLHINVETDGNGPQWLSNSTLLVNRYD